MKEYFVPYDIAKQLKEIGFDESCFGRYEAEKLSTYPLTCYSSTVECINAPLYDQVIEWFIDKHNLCIMAEMTANDYNGYDWDGFYHSTIRPAHVSGDCVATLSSRHEALNAGILKAIEVIKQKK